jgi:hypothetical protein
MQLFLHRHLCRHNFGQKLWRQLKLNPINNERKTMRNLIRASVLVLALSCFTYAGNMPINSTEPPPPPPPTTESIIQGDNTAPSNGIMQGSYTDSLTDAALNALGSVLSLF